MTPIMIPSNETFRPLQSARKFLSGLIDEDALTSVEKLRLLADGFAVSGVCSFCQRALLGRTHHDCDATLDVIRKR